MLSYGFVGALRKIEKFEFSDKNVSKLEAELLKTVEKDGRESSWQRQLYL